MENNHLGIANLFQMKKIIDYCSPDYCLSCAYFQQTKGNFGRCTVLKNDKKFDGSKKGSACNAWRLNKSLVDMEFQDRLNKRKKSQKTWLDKIRENYNNEVKQKQFESSRRPIVYDKDQIQRLFKISDIKTRSDGLPFARTSDCTRFRAYYKHKFNKRIIEFAIKLMVENKTLSSRQISKEMQKRFNRKISYQSVLDWGKKFYPERKFDLKNASYRSEIKNNISKGVKAYFQTLKLIKPTDEIKTQIIDLFFKNYTIREISIELKNKTNQKIFYKTIFDVLKKELQLDSEFKNSYWCLKRSNIENFIIMDKGITVLIKSENE